MSSTYPYAERYPVNATMPSTGRDRGEIITELRELAGAEDAVWEQGHCSGTMYCGDHDHYGFMAEAFELFAHVNVLQRDMCPSATRFEGEIIAMTLDMLNADAVSGDAEPVGMVTSGGSGSILHAVLAYREHGAANGVARPNIVKPETAHPAFDKAAFLLGVEVRRAPIDPDTTQADVAAMAELVDDATVALIGSATNYGYGTIDPIEELAELALSRGVGLHVDGCLGGFILPWGEALGYDLPLWDFRVPGVTTISADTHKYGYGFKGTSVLAFAYKELRNGQYFYVTDWTGGKYCSPGIEGSRSGGLLASTWAAMVSLGREGYLHHARGIFETSFALQDAVRTHPPVADHGGALLLLQLHQRRARHLPRQRLHADPRLAIQRPAVPGCDPHGGHPAPGPARGGRAVHVRSGRGGRLRRGRTPRTAGLGGDLRRCGRRVHGRGRRAHPHDHGRHDGRAAGGAVAHR